MFGKGLAGGRGNLSINVIANYTAKLWGIVAIYLFVPLYINILGLQAYGLIAFYSVALAILFIADAGISATFGREAAHEKDLSKLRDLLASLERILFAVVGFAGMCVFFVADIIAHRWLNTDGTLDADIAVQSIRLMAFALVPQIAMSLYVGGLMGLQMQVRANLMTILFGVIRSGLVILPLYYFSDVRLYFLWQALASWIFLYFVRQSLLKNLSDGEATKRGVFSWLVVRPLLGYAAGMFAMAFIAGINNQIDRLVVSKLLPITDFTFYSLAAMIAQVPAILTIPVAAAIYPKLIASYKEADKRLLEELYEKFSYIISTLGSASAFGLFFFGGDIIKVWLHGQPIPVYMLSVIQVLAIGSLFLSLQLPPYYLSLANGHTKTNVRLGLICMMVTVPAQVFFTRKFGIIGATIPWIMVNIFAFFYLSIVLNGKFSPIQNWNWLKRYVLPPVAICFLFLLAAKNFINSLGLHGIHAIGLAGFFGIAGLWANFYVWKRFVIRLTIFPKKASLHGTGL